MDIHRYSLWEHTGHLLVELPEGTALVDTGSPVSIGRGGVLSFAGQGIRLQESLLGVTTDTISAHLGADINFLLGMDVLCDRDVDFDLRNGVLEVGRDLGECSGEALPLEFIGGVPALDVGVAGQRALAVFDTGAPISYAARPLVEGLEPVRTVEDFHPSVGVFTTPLYPVNWAVGAIELAGHAGILPESFESALEQTGVTAILGTEILVNHRARLSVVRKSLALWT